MNRWRVLRTFVTVRWLRRMRTREQVERFQRRRIRAHLRYLRRHSPWFRDAPDDLSELARMDKATMMAHFDELNTVGIRREEALDLAQRAERSRDFHDTLEGMSVGLSSGTSGHRGLFLVSARERDAWAGTVLARTLPPGKLWGQRIALFLRASNTLYESVGSAAIRFRYFDLYADMDRSILDLARFDPTILVAPPSVLRVIAQAAPAIRPTRVYSVAEVLTDRDATHLARAFGQPVIHQLYQCTEGFLGHTCAHGTLHLNEDVAHIEREYLDEHRFVPVVTDFSRRAQPIVRYRLNDILVQRSTPCPCGSAFTALERIEGREDDTLLISGTRVFADLVTRALIAAPGFEQFRVRQLGPSLLEVQLDDLGAEPAVRSELARLWQLLELTPPREVYRQYDPGLDRKLRRVERVWTGGNHEAL